VFLDVCGEHIDDQARNLVRVLAENRRLDVLPAIAALYERLRAEAEGAVEAELISAVPVKDAHRDKIAQALGRRLGREVKLTCTEDKSLLGGAVLRAGDLVIDGSVKGKLARLAGTMSH
jgi:F-type H+-transporting ATPase subunit delta